MHGTKTCLRSGKARNLSVPPTCESPTENQLPSRPSSFAIREHCAGCLMNFRHTIDERFERLTTQINWLLSSTKHLEISHKQTTVTVPEHWRKCGTLYRFQPAQFWRHYLGSCLGSLLLLSSLSCSSFKTYSQFQ